MLELLLLDIIAAKYKQILELGIRNFGRLTILRTSKTISLICLHESLLARTIIILDRGHDVRRLQFCALHCAGPQVAL